VTYFIVIAEEWLKKYQAEKVNKIAEQNENIEYPDLTIFFKNYTFISFAK
jgi:hypothetical protein